MFVLIEYVASDLVPLVMENSLNSIKLTSSGESRADIPCMIRWDSVTNEDIIIQLKNYCQGCILIIHCFYVKIVNVVIMYI